MKNIILGLLIVFGLALNAQNNKYQFHLNLNEITSDLIQINLTTPTINLDKIIYNMP